MGLFTFIYVSKIIIIIIMIKASSEDNTSVYLPVGIIPSAMGHLCTS